MTGLVNNKTSFLFITFLGVVAFISFTWRGADYAISLLILFVLYVFAHELYDKNLYISLISCTYISAMLLLTILACKFDVTATILQHNKVAATYITDGTLLRVSTIGYLVFILGQFFIFHIYQKSRRQNVKLPAATERITPISNNEFLYRILAKYFIVIATCILAIPLVFGKNIIWLYPHLSRGVAIPFSTLLSICANLMIPMALNFIILSKTKVKTVIFYAVFFSILGLSSGSRANCVMPLLSVVLLFKYYNIYKLSFYSIIFIFAPIAGIVISFLGRLRYTIVENDFWAIVSSYLNEVKMGGLFEYIYSGLPVLGQNLSHYSAYLFLYESGQRSTIMPYLNGFVNILPRKIGIMMGLPVDTYGVHAWQLQRHGIISTGGSYLFGEPYWLGGLPAILIFSFLFGAIIMLLDLRFQKRKFIGHYLGGCLLLSLGIGYGFSNWMRALYLLVFSDIALEFIKRKCLK